MQAISSSLRSSVSAGSEKTCSHSTSACSRGDGQIRLHDGPQLLCIADMPENIAEEGVKFPPVVRLKVRQGEVDDAGPPAVMQMRKKDAARVRPGKLRVQPQMAAGVRGQKFLICPDGKGVRGVPGAVGPFDDPDIGGQGIEEFPVPLRRAGLDEIGVKAQMAELRLQALQLPYGQETSNRCAASGTR